MDPEKFNFTLHLIPWPFTRSNTRVKNTTARINPAKDLKDELKVVLELHEALTKVEDYNKNPIMILLKSGYYFYYFPYWAGGSAHG
uniref:Uncharacterized protein n=1 Tax=candidate division WOR-3 bacterium TaxID=2052148 RepID=A0A7C2NZX6_UNCW3